jgi:hypothetical protein
MEAIMVTKRLPDSDMGCTWWPDVIEAYGVRAWWRRWHVGMFLALYANNMVLLVLYEWLNS